MSVSATIEEAVKAYMFDHKDSVNSKPNKIHLSTAAYNIYLEEQELSRDDNPVLTHEEIQIVENKELGDPVFLEPRSIHE